MCVCHVFNKELIYLLTYQTASEQIYSSFEVHLHSVVALDFQSGRNLRLDMSKR